MADVTTSEATIKTQTQPAQTPVAEPDGRKSRLESYSQAYALSEVKVQKLLGHAKEQETALKACNDPRSARKLTGEILTTYTDVAKATKAAGRNLEAYLREEKTEERRKARSEAWGKLVTAVKNAIHRGFEAIFPKIPQDMQQNSTQYVAGLENLVSGLAKEVKELTDRVDTLEASRTPSVSQAPESPSPSISSGDPRVDKALDAVSGGKTDAMSMENLKAHLQEQQQQGQSGELGIKQPYEHTIPEPPAKGLGQAVKKAAKDLGQAAQENGVDVGDDGRKAQQAVMDSADRLDTSIDAAKTAPAAEVARAWTDVVKSAHSLTAAVGSYGKHVMAKAVEKGDKVRNIIGEKVKAMFKANKQALDKSVPTMEFDKVQAQSAEQAKLIADLQAQMAELLTQNRIQAAKLQPAGLEKAAMVQGLLEDGVSTEKLKDLSVPVGAIKQFSGRAHKVGDDGVALVDEKGKLVLLDKVAAEKLEHIRDRDEISVSRKDVQSEFAFRNRTIEQALGQGRDQG